MNSDTGLQASSPLGNAPVQPQDSTFDCPTTTHTCHAFLFRMMAGVSVGDHFPYWAVGECLCTVKINTDFVHAKKTLTVAQYHSEHREIDSIEYTDRSLEFDGEVWDADVSVDARECVRHYNTIADGMRQQACQCCSGLYMTDTSRAR